MLLESKPSSQSQKALPPAKDSVNQAVVPAKKLPKAQNQSPLQRGWQNLNFRPKLILVMLLLVGLPLVVLTQVLVRISGDYALKSLRTSVTEKGGFFTSEYVMWTNGESKTEAESIAKNIESLGIDINNQKAIASRLSLINSLVSLTSEDVDPESIKNFKIITDAQGRTVFHNIQVINQDFSVFPNLPPKDQPAAPLPYKVTPIASGTDLNVVPIVKNVISSGKPLYGIELLKTPALTAIGINNQANIGIRAQVIKGLSSDKQPVSEGTYDVDGGKAGLVSMAVYPIKRNNKVVGTAVVGAILNRNYGIVDKFTHKYNIAIATIFAQDWRVSTNTGYVDPTTLVPNNTRAIGTRVSSEVAKAVLDNEQKFLGNVNVAGDTQLAFYEPLYDHQRLLNPKAKPVGISAVATRSVEIDAQLEALRNVGYGVGLLSLAIAGGLAALIASSIAEPLRRLAGFTQKIGKGELSERLDSDRQDEIGVLSEELNRMTENLQQGINDREKESERIQLFAQIASTQLEGEQDVEKLVNISVSGVRENLNCDRVVVYRFREDKSGYIAAESVIAGLPKAIEDKVNDACIPDNLLAAYQTGRVVATDDLSQRNYHPDHVDLLNRLQIKANLVVPVLQRGKLYGLLIAHYCFSIHQWEEAEVRFMQQAAVQIGNGLDRASFLAEVEKSRQQAESIGMQQREEKELLQRHALELLMQVDPVSRGDLTVRADVTEDEMGTIADSYNALIRSLRKIVSEVKSASLEVTTSTQESEKTVKNVAIEALQQSESIDQALAQIQVMATSIKGVENRAQQAEQQMLKANQVVKAGDAAMNKTVAGISAIRETVSGAAEKVKRLDEASQKISKVVKLIGGFAAQTNLLALNASIEAARAGEDGEGFGVVANEVRALAQRSASATNEIRLLIEEIQTQTQSVVKAMESGSEQVITGTRLVEDSRQQLNQITAVNSQVNQLVQEIAKAAAVQTEASNSVGKKIQTVSAIASDTTKQTGQVANSFAELLAVAEKLQISVSQFKV